MPAFIRLILLLVIVSSWGTNSAFAKDEKSLREQLQKSQQLALSYPDSAIKIAEQALTQTSTPELLSMAHSIMGVALVHKGDFEPALFHHRKSLALTIKHNIDSQLGNTYNNLGVAFDYLGNYDSAVFYYEKGLELRIKSGKLNSVQGSLSNLGLVYYLKGDLNKSLQYLFPSLKIAESTKDNNGMVSSLINIAIVYEKLKKYDESIALLKQAISIAEKMNWRADLALCYNNLGVIEVGRFNYQASLEHHFKALKIREEIGDKGGLAMSYQNIGSALYHLNQFNDAVGYLDKGLVLSDSISDLITSMEILNVKALASAKTNKKAEALQYVNRAIAIAENHQDYINRYQVYRAASVVYEANGQFKEALGYNKLYHQLLDSVENQENTNMLVEKEQAYKYEKKKQEDEFIANQERLKQEAEITRQNMFNYLLGLGILSLLIILGFILRSLKQRKKANELLTTRNNLIENQKKLIEEKNKDITDSIQYAKRLQQAILPTQKELNYLKDHFILFEPKDIVSGDFYLVIPLSENDVIFGVIDCTGHGVPGGFVSIVAHNALMRAVKEFGIKEPAAILNKVNELIDEIFHKEGKDAIQDGMDIALCRLNNRELKFAGANNPIWIFDEQNCIEIKGDKQPVGAYVHRKPFTQHTMRLQQGQLLVLFSDGYADQFGGPGGKKFKYSRMKELIQTNKQQHPEKIRKVLLENILSWRGTLEQIDDICVLGISIR